MNVPVLVLFAVFIAIAVRQTFRIPLQIWQIMLTGAAIVLLTGQIKPDLALNAIDPQVMIFLFWMFLAGRALEESGYLERLAWRLFCRARNADALLMLVIAGCGLLSALLMNDTIAIVGTPLMLSLARQHGMHSRPMLLALAFSVTTGSVMSPMGNPQNLLIAISGVPSNAFVLFAKYLALPTIVSLGFVFLLLKFSFREHFGNDELIHEEPEIRDSRLAAVSRLSIVIALTLTLLNIVLTAMPGGHGFPITWIAAGAGLPVLLMSDRRMEMLRTLDWKTLIFFAAMFVLMKSVWQTGFFQRLFSEAGIELTSVPALMAISILLSQLVSNVPLVALFLPLLSGPETSQSLLLALAAGSTIAGNLLIFGAASNVIIVQNAESRGDEGIGFLEFARVGVPLTLIQAIIYSIAFTLMT